MPFRSEVQRRFLWAKHPEVAKRWASESGTPENLPKRVPKTTKTPKVRKR